MCDQNTTPKQDDPTPEYVDPKWLKELERRFLETPREDYLTLEECFSQPWEPDGSSR